MAAHDVEKRCYMDGHERPDVIDYRVNTFLPLMAQLEKRMVHWVANGSELVTAALLAYWGSRLDGVVARVGNRDGATKGFREAQP
jgi:hypothetical protein